MTNLCKICMRNQSMNGRRACTTCWVHYQRSELTCKECNGYAMFLDTDNGQITCPTCVESSANPYAYTDRPIPSSCERLCEFFIDEKGNYP